MRKQFLLIFAIISLISCDESDVPNYSKVYYNFDESDLLRIPNYTVGQSLLYKNEIGGEILFKVSSIDLPKKNLYAVGMGFFTTYAQSFFYYDSMEIFFEGDSTDQYVLSYKKWPNNVDLATEDPYKKIESDISIKISYFPYWNELNAFGYQENQIYVGSSNQKVSLTINGKLFDNVVKIVSNNNEQITENKNINIIYYCDGIGIIGFDDLDNNEWRLQ